MKTDNTYNAVAEVIREDANFQNSRDVALKKSPEPSVKSISFEESGIFVVPDNVSSLKIFAAGAPGGGRVMDSVCS